MSFWISVPLLSLLALLVSCGSSNDRESVPRSRGSEASSATTTPVQPPSLVVRIKREINDPRISVRLIGGKVFLEGTVTTNLEANRAVEIAIALAGPKIVDLLKIAP